jgi:hypothetical protein
MTLITVETVATVTPEGMLTVRVPQNISPGEHRVVLMLEAADAREPAEEGPELEEVPETLGPFGIRVHDFGPWPEGLSLRRACSARAPSTAACVSELPQLVDHSTQ